MTLSNEQITKFQKLYKDRFGVELNEEEASEKGTKLVLLMKLVYQPEQDCSEKAKHPVVDRDVLSEFRSPSLTSGDGGRIVLTTG